MKPVTAAKRLMPGGQYVKPYDGAKDMLLVDNVDDKNHLKLLESIADELPAQKEK